MCGRYGRTTPAKTFAKILDAEVSDKLDDKPRYNCPPGTFQGCALKRPTTGKIAIGPAWWGFVPSWVDSARKASINARSETVATLPMFAKSFAQRRCLLLCNFWFEWRRDGDDKQPYAIRPADGEPFFFAGIWRKASNLPESDKAAGQVSFAILTGEPQPDIAHIHARQPQALKNEAARAWLDETLSTDELTELLDTGRHQNYESWPVSHAVGKPSNDYPEIIEPVSV